MACQDRLRPFNQSVMMQDIVEPESVTRPDEASVRPPVIEDPSNRFFIHRISRALLTPAIRFDIHPNTVSVLGLLCGAGAALAYWHWRDPLLATLGFVLMIGWHICDGLDGQLARATGKVSAIGRLLDGLCDYATFVMVMLALALSFDNWPPMLGLALISGALHALQSAYYESQRESWIRRSLGKFAARARSLAGGRYEQLYNVVEEWLGNHSRPIDAALRANPALLPRYLGASAPVLQKMVVLSANSRTLTIWLACIAGQPILYFYWEIFGLTLIALLLAARLRHVEAGLCTLIDK